MRVVWMLLVLLLVPGCRDGYTVVIECDRETCSGHGECGLDADGNLVCLCDSGFVAVSLECLPENPHPCTDIDCSGHGTCGVTQDNQLLCACDEGYRNQDPLTCVPDPAGCQSDEQCDDNNECTDDSCASGSCQHQNNTQDCDDGLFCTAVDACLNGTCRGLGDPCGGQPCDEDVDACVECLVDLDCQDSNACTDDTCESGACVYQNNAEPCDDGLFCTETDACSGGTCVGSGDPCAGQVCDEVNDGCETVLYWGTYTNTLARTTLASGNTEVLLTGVHVHDLHMVPGNGNLYWTDRDANAIYWSPVDNPNAQELISAGWAQGLVVDWPARKIYYSTLNNIYAADLDGSNPTLLYDSGAGAGLDLDEAAGKLYWVSSVSVHRCDLDGSNYELVMDVPGASAMGNIRIDDAGQRAFVTDYNNGTVTSISLTGGPVTEIISGLSNPSGLAIDHANGKLYVGTLHQILRSNLDGTDLELDIVDHPNTFQVWGLAIPR